MKALDLFLPYVNLAVMGCPEPLALQAIRFSCIEFCKRTDIVQRIGAPANIVAGTQDYSVVIPAEMQLGRVLGAAWQGVWLTPIPPGDVQSDVALRGASIGTAAPRTGDPRFFFQKTPDASTVSLYPIPDTALTGGLLIKAAFYPTQAALTVEDQLFDDWAEGIAAGAIAKIQAIPGQPFSANNTAAKLQFEAAVSAAKHQKLTGKLTSGVRVQPRRFM